MTPESDLYFRSVLVGMNEVSISSCAVTGSHIKGCPVTAHDEMLGYKYDQCSRWHIFALKKTRASG